MREKWLKENNKLLGKSLFFYPFVLTINCFIYASLATVNLGKLGDELIRLSIPAFEIFLIGCGISFGIAGMLSAFGSDWRSGASIDKYIYIGFWTTILLPNILALIKLYKAPLMWSVSLVVITIGSLCVSYVIVKTLNKINKNIDVLHSPTFWGWIGTVITAIISGLLQR